MSKLLWMIWIAVAFSGFAIADEGHHEKLTAEQLGTVHFPISCSPEAQKTFLKGVALLHSFWYEEAEKSFLEVAKQDPKVCDGALGCRDEFVASVVESTRRPHHQARFRGTG